ncbi:hypothetical protein MRX96_041330 [Rhipicephalus microplus]
MWLGLFWEQVVKAFWEQVVNARERGLWYNSNYKRLAGLFWQVTAGKESLKNVTGVRLHSGVSVAKKSDPTTRTLSITVTTLLAIEPLSNLLSNYRPKQAVRHHGSDEQGDKSFTANGLISLRTSTRDRMWTLIAERHLHEAGHHDSCSLSGAES